MENIEAEALRRKMYENISPDQWITHGAAEIVAGLDGDELAQFVEELVGVVARASEEGVVPSRSITTLLAAANAALERAERVDPPLEAEVVSTPDERPAEREEAPGESPVGGVSPETEGGASPGESGGDAGRGTEPPAALGAADPDEESVS